MKKIVYLSILISYIFANEIFVEKYKILKNTTVVYEQKIEDNPNDIDAYNLLAYNYLELNKPQKAINVYKRLLKVQKSVEVNNLIAKIYFDQLKDINKTKETLLYSLELDKNNIFSLSSLAKIESTNKNYKEALKYLYRLVEIDDVYRNEYLYKIG